jgi:hypothetical protein
MMKKLKLIICVLSGILVAGCEDLFVKPVTSNLNVEDFEAAWNRINDTYPFLDYKHINWDSIYQVYRPRSESAQGDEFYFVLHDLLAELQDGHVYYQTEGGGEIYPFYPQRYFRVRHAYSPFVVRTYFDRELILTASGREEYGILPDNIGYIFLSSFHENYLISEFPSIMDYMKNTIGLIIDIRQKVGGSFQNIEAVAGHFIDAPFDWPKFYVLGELSEIAPFQPIGSYTYNKPVVVLINGSTFSAGEITTEVLKQLPNITAVGDTTGGGGGASANNSPETRSDFKLPSGKLISVPNSYLARYDGQPFEWAGITPDILIQQTEEDIRNGRDKQLEYAIDMLK